MKERPMLMSAPMVRAILAGTKTQTRRVVKPQPPAGWDRNCWFSAPVWGWTAEAEPTQTWHKVRCPYGQPGDRLWVRESWMPDPPCDGTWGYTAWAGSRIGQIAAVPERFQHPAFCNYRASWLHGTDGLRWTPGIHMPRWASRITLEVAGVRVERLQDISVADALAEGIVQLRDGGYGLPAGEHYHATDPCISYWSLWDHINGPGSVEANPWVWVVEFKRLEARA